MIKFGKHKDKSYDYMLENEKSYCMYVLNQIECSGAFREFQDFVNKNRNKLYDINELKNLNSINCSKLTNYMFNDINVINLIKDIKITSVNKDKIFRNEDIKPSLFGQFIDYLIRYEIAKIKNILFKDDRTEIILSYHLLDEFWDLQNLVYESLQMNLDKIDNLDDNFVNKLVEKSKKEINEIKKMIINYKNKINQYQFIKDSYLKMQNYNDVSLNDVLNVSISHSLFFDRNEDIKYKNYKKEIITKKSYESIIDYIKQKTNNKKNILLNPTLGNSYLGIDADADLIIDNELIDIKVSKSIGLNINDFIQLIIYATLYYLKTNIICKKISIYNPILGKENYIIINIDIIKNFVNILENYNIGNHLKKNKSFTFITPNIKCNNISHYETEINKESTFIESLILSIEELNLTDELEDSIEILNSHRDIDDYLRIENIERLDKEIKKIINRVANV